MVVGLMMGTGDQRPSQTRERLEPTDGGMRDESPHRPFFKFIKICNIVPDPAINGSWCVIACPLDSLGCSYAVTLMPVPLCVIALMPVPLL